MKYINKLFNFYLKLKKILKKKKIVYKNNPMKYKFFN
jgi:hypothetical protein